MALGKYTRVDNGRRPSSNYCSTITIVVFVALCLVGIWMMTSSSVVPVRSVDDAAQQKKNEVKDQVPQRTAENDGNSQSKGPQFEDSLGDLPVDATKVDSNATPAKSDSTSNAEENQLDSEEKMGGQSNEETKSDNGSRSDVQNGETRSNDGDIKKGDGQSDSESGETKADAGENSGGQASSEEHYDEKKLDSDGSNNKPVSDDGEKKFDSNDTKKKSDSDNDGTKSDGSLSETGEAKSYESTPQHNGEKAEGQTLEKSSSESKDNNEADNKGSSEIFPFGAQSELLNESKTQNGSFSTQAAESKNEKEAQLSSNQQSEYSWKLCNTTAGPDYIPCLDNLKAIKSLRSTKHYEHRERHCPEQPPTCLVPLPEGFKRPIKWPKSRGKIWFYNMPHTKLAEVKGDQNWVKVTGEYLTFPGGGTQFKHGAVHYIDCIEQSVAQIAWGKRSRVILDVGCGVASFGGFLFDKDVLTMSFAPKDEHEAQVQFALERGIPAILAVMGTKRLPFPGRVFDVIHCARCRVPWHIEGGKLLLELNRVLRPGGFFVWSATPVYKKLPEDVGIWKAMQRLTKAMCWELVNKTKDVVNGVGIATYRKPTSNECYKKRSQQEPPLCSQSDDPNAVWNVPLRACMHKVPTDATERGSQWPEQWPARLEKSPYWLSSYQVGVYGKSAPEDFTADYAHWKRVVTESYLKGMGIDWSSVRNVMDMRAVYGGFAAALRDLNVWVMNIVTIDSPDTLPIIYERGLFGVYHDWCESFSTYPRSYDLLHADHLFSNIKKRCSLVAVVAEVDRMVRPEGKIIVRDDVVTINELESMLRSMQWEVRMTYSKDNEGLLCVQKSMWRPKEAEMVTYAIA